LQLAEAILTEPAPHSSHSSENITAIQLADARTPLPRSSEDQERELFLSGQDSDEEDDDEGEGLKRAERGRMFNHPAALLSTVDVGQIDGNRYDPLPGQEANGRRAAGKTLSSKAGIILVRHISHLFTDSITGSIASKL